jgi:hypothetical protein
MSYITPITDRTLSDVLARNPKGLFNVSDWMRICGNAQDVVSQANSLLGLSIVFDPVFTPTISTDPTTLVSNFNTLLANIGITINAISAYHVLPIQPFNTKWIAGAGQTAATYLDVNQWEQAIDIMHSWLNSLYHTRTARSGITYANAGLTRNNGWRG